MEEILLKSKETELLETLSNGAAHDINNLLTVIKARASLMLHCVTLTDPLYKHIKAILKSVDMGNEITGALLDCVERDYIDFN